MQPIKPHCFISAELEFWLEAFLHAANPQGLEVVQPLPQLSTIAATHPTNNSQSEALRNHEQTSQNHPKTAFRPPHTTTHSITAELEFRRVPHAAPGGPSRNNTAHPLLQLSTYEANPGYGFNAHRGGDGDQKLDVSNHGRKLTCNPARILLARRLNHDTEQLLGAGRSQ